MSKIVTQTGVTTTTDYLSGFQYKKKTASEPVELQFFPHAEGYVNATQNGTSYTFNYVYNYTDHLGNIRLSYSQDPSTNVLKVIEENHYYPFGLKHTGYNSDKMMYIKEESFIKIKSKPALLKTSYDKKFNGKSWETDLSLNVYDFHARGYMPDIVRTFQQDPLAEKFSNMSPYSFLNNNPLYFVDPDGKAPLDHIFNANGRFIRDTGVGNAVKIQVGNKLLNPSQLSTTDGSKYAMRNIGAYYAEKIGADKGIKIGTGRNTKNSDANPAFTIGKTIYLNTNGGFSKSLDNVSSFKNIMSHENNHKEDNENPKFEGNTLSNHADVYINQMSHETFSSAPDDYKVGTALSFGNYLLNMDQSGKFEQNEILDKIENFNNTNNGGLYIVPPIGNFSQGTLNLDVSHKNKKYPVEYKKLNE